VTGVPDFDRIRRVAREDQVLLDAFDRVTLGRQGERTDLVDNVHEVSRPTGNGRQRALRVLREKRPDLQSVAPARARAAVPPGAHVPPEPLRLNARLHLHAQLRDRVQRSRSRRPRLRHRLPAGASVRSRLEQQTRSVSHAALRGAQDIPDGRGAAR
jgi:hypothetical protein